MNWAQFIQTNAVPLLVVVVVVVLFVLSRAPEITAWLARLIPEPAPPQPLPPTPPPIPPQPEPDDEDYWEEPMEHYVALIRFLADAGETKAVTAMEGEVWDAVGRIIATEWEDA